MFIIMLNLVVLYKEISVNLRTGFEDFVITSDKVSAVTAVK